MSGNPYDEPTKKPASKKGKQTLVDVRRGATQKKGKGEGIDLGDILGILDKPGQAAKAAIATGSRVARDTFTPGRPGGPKRSRAGLDDVVKDSVKGLVGKKKTTATELVSEVATGDPDKIKKLPFGVSTVVDTVADPTNFLSFGTTAAAKKGLQAAAQVAAKKAAQEGGEEAAEQVLKRIAKEGTRSLDDATRAEVKEAIREKAVASGVKPEKAARTADNLLKAADRGGKGGIKVAGRTVVPGSSKAVSRVTAPAASAAGRLAGGSTDRLLHRSAGAAQVVGKDVAEDVRRAATSAADRTAMRQGITDAAATNIAKAAKLTPERMIAAMKVLDGGDVAAGIQAAESAGDQGMADLLRFVDGERQRLYDEGVDKLGRPASMEGAPSTVPQFLTPEGMRVADVGARRSMTPSELAARLSPEGRMPVGSQAVREAVEKGSKGAEGAFRGLNADLSILDINQRAGKQLVGENPLEAIVRAGHEHARHLETRDLVQRVQAMVDPQGQPLLRKLESSAKPVNGEVMDFSHVGLGQFEVHPEIAGILRNIQAVTRNDSAWRDFTETAEGAMRVWRSMATFGPAFHARNAVGNLWNNFLGGVKNPAVYARAASIQKKVHQAFKSAAPGDDLDAILLNSGLDASDQLAMRTALQEGVISRGFFDTDLVPGTSHLGPPSGKLLTRTLRKANGANRRAGSVVENNARLAHYLHKLDELGDATAAADSVKKFLFDYSDLTPAERAIKGTFVPFYTFMRKNFPLQLEQAGRQPWKFNLAGNAIEDAEGQGVGYRPDLPIFAADDILRMVTGQAEPGRPDDGYFGNAVGAIADPLNPAFKVLFDPYLKADDPLQNLERLINGSIPLWSKGRNYVNTVKGEKSPLETLLGLGKAPGAVDKKKGRPKAAPAPVSGKNPYDD